MFFYLAPLNSSEGCLKHCDLWDISKWWNWNYCWYNERDGQEVHVRN